jgi:diamine N-acetyltransferase
MTEIPPSVSLRPVTPENFNEVARMQVRDDQKHFVASNLYSLAEAHVFPGRKPLAIYADETPVGFLMYCYWEEHQQYWIFRLLVDEKYQGRGYGRAAMRLVIERMRALPDCTQIYISYEPQNNAARTLYASLGFVITGEIIGEEEVAVLEG